MKAWTPIVLGLSLAAFALALTLGRGATNALPVGEGEELTTLLWYLFAGGAVFCAAITALHPKIIYSGLALLGCFGGVAGLFVYLAADFVAVTQVAVYIGGILVLILFAIMLTSRIGVTEVTNPSIKLPLGLGLGTLMLCLLVFSQTGGAFRVVPPGEAHPTTQALGDAFLGKYLFPFELASVLLVAVIIGAVVLVRKELPSSNPESDPQAGADARRSKP